ncbi:helix-turn-helix transcriptional regulator [Leucobacter denitrificans]|uniref:helix-turn-helix transcriptional regulator n=1 Tax=Leucobacter denitrificans TaxID=683042 RepID=UPI00362121CF
MTKHELLSSVYGYADRYNDAGQRVALDRQFERDKEQLRSLGIPVETIDSPGEPGNNHLARYRVPKTALEVPHGLEFSDRELMMLRVAALAWREGSLSAEAARALMKLESLGALIDAPRLGVSAGFGATDPAAPALLQAIGQQAEAEFDYQLADRNEPLRRRVMPLQLHRFEGRWHLISYDLERESPRVFLLSRIVGAVSVRVGSSTWNELPAAIETLIEEAVSGLQRLQEQQRVAVRVKPGSIAETALLSRSDSIQHGDEDCEIQFGTVDLPELATEIAGFGTEVTVLDPPSLQQLVRERFEAALELHSATRVENAHA